MRFNKTDATWLNNRGLSPLQNILRHHVIEILFTVALVVTALLSGLATHPGVHLAGITILLDILIYKLASRRTSPAVVIGLSIINLLNLIIILVATDSVELWFTGLYGVFVILLVLFSDRH